MRQTRDRQCGEVTRTDVLNRRRGSRPRIPMLAAAAARLPRARVLSPRDRGDPAGSLQVSLSTGSRALLEWGSAGPGRESSSRQLAAFDVRGLRSRFPKALSIPHAPRQHTKLRHIRHHGAKLSSLAIEQLTVHLSRRPASIPSPAGKECSKGARVALTRDRARQYVCKPGASDAARAHIEASAPRSPP